MLRMILGHAFVVFLVSFFVFAYVTLLFGRKKDVNIWRDIPGSPFIIFFYPEFLTDTGLLFRKATFFSFVSIIVVVLLLTLIQ